MITACATSQNLEFVTCKLQILSTSIEYSFCFKTHSNLSRILQFFKLGVYWSTTFVLQQHVCCNKGILTRSQILLVKFSWDISLFVYLIKEESLNAFESIVLNLLSTHNMFLMISTYDLIAMYLAIKLQSLYFYVIATLKRDYEFSTEVG